MRTERQHNDRKKEIMEKCFDCYAENGLTGTGIKTLAKECGCTSGTLYVYFKNLDELIVESTAYCMAKVEEDFMSRSPNSPSELMPISLTDFAKNAESVRFRFYLAGFRRIQGVRICYNEREKREFPQAAPFRAL